MKRLLTTVLAVACVGLASAQWKKPTVEATSEPIVDEPSYLYNTGTQMFLTQGNAYGTQGSVAGPSTKSWVRPHQVDLVTISVSSAGTRTLTSIRRSLCPMACTGSMHRHSIALRQTP